MVLLKQKLLLTSCTFPICLMPNDARFLPGPTCYVTGWGRLATNGPHPTMLQEAQVPLVSRELCNNPEIYNGLIHERALCAGSAEGGVGPCQFDSGGPLACQESGLWYLSGVVSWGVGCGEPNKLGVYSDMSVLMDWVKDMVATDASFIWRSKNEIASLEKTIYCDVQSSSPHNSCQSVIGSEIRHVLTIYKLKRNHFTENLCLNLRCVHKMLIQMP